MMKDALPPQSLSEGAAGGDPLFQHGWVAQLEAHMHDGATRWDVDDWKYPLV